MKGTDNRASISQRPSTTKLVDEMIAASGLSKTDIYNAGADVLHFVWSALRAGYTLELGKDGVHTPTEIFIPGLIRRDDWRPDAASDRS